MPGRVAGKVAFITGAARGQGRSHAVRLAEEGADIIAVDICDPVDSVPYPMATSEELDQTAKEVSALGRKVLLRKADVRDPDAIRSVVDDGVAEFGRLDIVVSNAGIGGACRVVDMSDSVWRDMIDTQLTGAFHVARAAIPHLEHQGVGSVVFTSSGTVLRPFPNIADYVAAKHGITGLMKVLELELAPSNIRVNAILSGLVDTAMIHNPSTYALFRPDVDSPTREQVSEVYLKMNALAVPWVESADVSNGVVFLASDEARYVTGVELPVCAGSSI